MDADHAVHVVPKIRAHRVSVRAGPFVMTVSPAEALVLADQLVDAAERIDRQTPTTATKETP